MVDSGSLFTIQLALLWLDLALIVGLVAAWLVRTPPPKPPRSSLLVSVAILLLALALRAVVSPHTLIHENAHGYEYLRSAFIGEGYPYHGAGYYAFFRLVTAVTGPHPQAVFWGNALLSALTALLLIPTGRLVTGNREVGEYAALVYALWPATLRIAASESMFPLALFLALASLWAWLSALRSGDPLRYLLAGLLLAFVVQVRPIMALWPAVVLVSSITQPSWRAQFRRAWPWLALGACAVVCSGWIAFRILDFKAQGVHGMVDLSPARALVLAFSQTNLLWNPGWTPFAVLGTGILGLVVAIRHDRRFLVTACVGLALLAWFGLAPSQGAEPSQLRLQSPLQLVFVLCAGFGLAWLAALLPRPPRRAGSILLIAVVTTSSSLRFDAVGETFNPQQELAFLADTVRDLPPECMVVTADKFMADRVLVTEFPGWWLDGPRTSLDAVEDEASLPDLWPCVLWYRGLTCQSFTWQERGAGRVPASGVREECSQVEEMYELTPLAEHSFENRPYLGYIQVPRDTVEIGFYRVGMLESHRP